MTSKADITRQLGRLGLLDGAIVMVHASLRRVGPIDGGAAGLIEALRAAMGPSGTLVMVLGADADDPFDALETEVDVEDMGALAEVFRATPA